MPSPTTSWLAREIASQPALIEELLVREIPHITAIVARLPPFSYVVIAARGSSDHAATYAVYSWAALAGWPVALAAPSLYTLYQTPPRLEGALVVGISQSGQSPDIVAVLAEARRQGRPTLAITNDRTSPLGSIADEVVELGVGIEQSVAATKTYVAQLAVIAAFAAIWSGNSERLAELHVVPVALGAVLQQTGDIAGRIQRYRDKEAFTIIGRGYNYATAFELALKLKELTYMQAIAYSSADFRHGPMATIGRGSPVILIMPGGVAYADLYELALDLSQREADLLVISDIPEALALATTPLALAVAVPEWLSPLTTILPGQILALQLTLARGLNPDAPRGLHKVTRTL
ncbi:MAG TPA: SIS domain-containing protein [Ktedonobacterales bacterium]|jgi:glucosamine--fructose-6-phosphate aminotransferase (isomerizing)